jgi:hypothetical protein
VKAMLMLMMNFYIEDNDEDYDDSYDDFIDEEFPENVRNS